MPVEATSTMQTLRLVGDVWPLHVGVRDEDGVWASVTPTVTVTRPDDTTTPVTAEGSGYGGWSAAYTLAAPGRHIAVVAAAGYGSAAFTIEAVNPTPAGAMPKLPDCITYLGDHSWDDDEVADALGAETDAQRSICVIPAYYPRDLRNALMRRVARNLSMRRIPVAMPIGDAEAGTSTTPSPYDPEINRLERPHRRLLIA